MSIWTHNGNLTRAESAPAMYPSLPWPKPIPLR